VEQHEGEQPRHLGVVDRGRELPGEQATSPGWSNRTPETVRLARLMRCAMAASGTR
jgi:hypothetical protein